MANTLRYKEDGTFKIVQFTDLHWENGGKKDGLTRDLMVQVINEEHPDLVVFTGDMIESQACIDPRRSFRQAIAAAESSGTPWAAVFGNHDTEAGITREELMAVQLQCDHCITESGPENISGIGNFVVRLLGRDEITDKALFFLDSGSYGNTCAGGYAAIARDQIEWYVRESEALASERGDIVPALAFFHIPLPEYRDVWELATCYGSKYEEVCSPHLNSGMFAAMVETDNIIGTFVGHDHINDYIGELYGIRLCYGRQTGYNNYSRSGFTRGARIILLEEGKRDFRTWLRLHDGEMIYEQSEHRPEKRKG
ncbi:metallophosphoesterase family protein [Paenibacillus sp. sptzw28]|uniref:metallophosphoesterase family protein n=1 Tax=Paenibacillus sp. sptzw28 TaxID=715179 RepID=UPI001C6F3DCC|nr:metallophosphoesterase family protein [Paenibacillus sp. sptzw28]QYR23601.1 metallophosphoesterase family protein [Paenibacillus sp. sptzw28]